MSLLYPPAPPLPDEDDFVSALHNYLPRGRAWPRADDANLTALLRGLARAWQTAHVRQANLIGDAFPASSIELLPEWEASLGLPDPCLGDNPTTSARQAAVLWRLTDPGGQSIAYYQNLAATLGGTIDVTEYAPFRWGVNHWGEPLYTAGWAFAWTVTLSAGSIFYFEIGRSHWGEPYWRLANSPIACEIQRLAPAHTVVNFTLGPGVPADPFLLDVSLFDGFAGLV